jgi:hypothetical protein
MVSGGPHDKEKGRIDLPPSNAASGIGLWPAPENG